MGVGDPNDAIGGAVAGAGADAGADADAGAGAGDGRGTTPVVASRVESAGCGRACEQAAEPERRVRTSTNAVVGLGDSPTLTNRPGSEPGRCPARGRWLGAH